MNIKVIYEDDYIIGINKPSGLVVHPGVKNKKGTIVNGMIDQFANLSDVKQKLKHDCYYIENISILLDIKIIIITMLIIIKGEGR